MNAELLQGITDIVFKGNLLFLSPFLFLLMVILFADRLVGLIYDSMQTRSGRRSRY